MISAIIFRRVIKCQTALPSHWKREWFRTFPCTGFALKDHSEHDTKNNVDKTSKQDTDLKMHNEKKNRGTMKSFKKQKISDDRLKSMPMRVQKHILKLMNEERAEPPKPPKRPDQSTLPKDDKNEENDVRMSMQMPNKMRNVSRHVQRLQELGKFTEKSTDEETKQVKIQALQRHVQRLQNTMVEEKVPSDINKDEETKQVKIQAMQRHVQRLQNTKVEEKVSSDINKEVKRNETRIKRMHRHVRNLQMENRVPDEAEVKKPKETNLKPSSTVKRIEAEPEVLEEILGILDNCSPSNEMRSHSDTNAVSMEVWDTLKTRELKLATTYYPRNPFEEMIMWTEKGTMWKFPINNEEGLTEEENVHFSEHIFLDQHLEEWCPKIGPIRHYMELVCLGLSKNPYMTVDEKVAHINWYKNYFTNQIELLEQIGAWDSNVNPELNESQSSDQEQSQSV